MKYDNGGFCETCYWQCNNCMLSGVDVRGMYGRSQHNPDTMECPVSEEEAEENRKENYRRSHHGFLEDDFKYESFKIPGAPMAKNQGIRENLHLARVTHKETGLWGESVGWTYWEPLQGALKTLRRRIDTEKKIKA